MTSKFNTIFESNFSRYQGGGFLTGDIIKLKQGWNQDEWSTKAPQQLIDKLRELDESDLILRVSSVKTLRPAVNSSVDQALGTDDFHIDITQEIVEQKLVNSNYFKRLSYINIFIELAIYFIIEIINICLIKNLNFIQILPILIRVKL